jgi:hypothetical protein
MSAHPSQLMVLQCGAVNGGNCLTRVVVAGPGVIRTGQLSRTLSVTADITRIFVGTYSGWWAWGYWTPATGW